MLCELHVANLGVIGDVTVVLPEGLTALTGETGAGKTLLVGAINLLLGGRADGVLVRPGADEALVEARFDVGGDEHVLRRVIPRAGRSRAYVDGRLCTLTELAALAGDLVEVHGQHAQHRLLRPAAQRAALDAHAGIDPGPLRSVDDELRRLEAELEALGGDPRQRAREMDLLRYQIDEIDGVAITGPDEEEELVALQAVLADATAHREAAAAARALIADDGGARDRLAEAVRLLRGRAPFTEVARRLEGVTAELDDLVGELRHTAEAVEDDPARLAEVGERLRRLADLRRKYGEDLAAVLAFREAAATRVAELASVESRVAELDERRRELAARRAGIADDLARQRRRAAGPFARAVTDRLRALAMPHATVTVDVDGDAGRDVQIRLAANPDSPPAPLSRVASGGELARVMLAIDLVTRPPGSAPTVVFDEVDAGLGGAAAIAVADALADLAGSAQVLVVTHLPQVAARAGHHLVVDKRVRAGRTTTGVRAVTGEDRVREVARMLAGRPGSEVARRHARELLGIEPPGADLAG